MSKNKLKPYQGSQLPEKPQKQGLIKQLQNYVKIHIHDVKQWFKWTYQTWTRGYSDCNIWNLDSTIAQFILPRLKAFQNLERRGHPHNLTAKQWESALLDMVYAMEMSAKGDWNLPKKYDEKKHRRGLEFFGKYFNYLWD